MKTRDARDEHDREFPFGACWQCGEPYSSEALECDRDHTEKRDPERSSAIKTIIRRLIKDWPVEYEEVLVEMTDWPEDGEPSFAELGARVFNNLA